MTRKNPLPETLELSFLDDQLRDNLNLHAISLPLGVIFFWVYTEGLQRELDIYFFESLERLGKNA
jgi:hypothetical protein